MAFWSLNPWNRNVCEIPNRYWHDSWDPFEDLIIPSLDLARSTLQSKQRQPNGPFLRNDDNNFTVRMDVSNFAPEEIQVKAVDDYLVVHGKHEERKDNHGWVSREFTRRYMIPQDCQTDKLASSLSPNGVLTIQAPKKPKEIEGSKARSIPITFEQNTNKQVIHESAKK